MAEDELETWARAALDELEVLAGGGSVSGVTHARIRELRRVVKEREAKGEQRGV